MAAVDKIEDKRKPEEYICHRNRKNLSMPCRKTNCRSLPGRISDE